MSLVDQVAALVAAGVPEAAGISPAELAAHAAALPEVPGAVLIAQRVHPYRRPRWPGAAIVHLDLMADDLDAAAERAVALGATVPEQPDPRWRVLLDPAGHPFCLTPFTPTPDAGRLGARSRPRGTG